MLGKIVKRDSDDTFQVSFIANGFLVEARGRDSDSDWVTEKVFFATLGEVSQAMQEYADLDVA